MTTQNPRQLALLALRTIQGGAYADIALDRTLHQVSMSDADRRLMTELVYGSVRRQRTLDALIDQLAKKKSHQQPPELRLILHLGLYQLRYLNHIPPSAAVDTTVELAKQNGFKGLAGFVNGVLRQYTRLPEPLTLPQEPIARLGVQHSFPDWMIQVWLDEYGEAATTELCQWLNQPPHIDLRINPLRSSIEQVETAMHAAGIAAQPLPLLPHALRLPQGVGAIQNLPGFTEGWWSVQDASAQLVSHLVDPQPGEVVIDACAAPGGKTTHLAELMQDQGTVWGCDLYASRLKKLSQNAGRLHLKSIQLCTGDSRTFDQFIEQADRVLLDAPCSGLGTLHRHADARWRQTPDTVRELAQLQTELLNHTATWVKLGGILVYATCTLHPLENEAVVDQFLTSHPQWKIDPPVDPAIDPPAAQSLIAKLVNDQGWLKVLPHQQDMDGFFMVRLRKVGRS